MEKYTDAEYTELYGESQPANLEHWIRFNKSNSPKFIRFATVHSEVTPDYTGSALKKVTLPDNNTKVEIIMDFDNNTTTYYINGEKSTSEGLGEKATLTQLGVKFSRGIKYFDNFTIVHYPNNVPAQTFTMSSGDVDYVNGLIPVYFNSDVNSTGTYTSSTDTSKDTVEGDVASETVQTYESTATHGSETLVTTTTVALDEENAKTITTVKRDRTYNYSAPYGITFGDVDNAETADVVETIADYITVKNSAGVTVKATITKGSKTGEYLIAPQGGIVEGETYTISLPTTVTDILGATVNAETASISVSAPRPQILVHRDYDDFLAKDDLLNGAGYYGEHKFQATATFHKAVKPFEGNDGQALQFNTGSGGQKSNGVANPELPITLDSGKLYIGLDIARKTDEALVAQDGETPVTHHNYFTLKGAKQQYIYFYTQHTDAAADWEGGGIGEIFVDTAVQRMEFIVDLDANKIHYYKDGVFVKSGTCTTDLQQLSLVTTNGIEYLDNLTIVHYPNDIKPQTFSLQDAKVDKENKTITVDLKSDVAFGGYEAPYAVSTEVLQSGDFVVKDADGTALEITSVEAGTAYNEYVITVSNDLVDGATYTVATSAERTDILGATLDNTATAETYVVPETYFDLTFDGYSGVGTQFSPYPFSGDKPKYQKAVEDEKLGTGLEIFLPDGATYRRSDFIYKFKAPVSSGKLTASFDIMFTDDYDGDKQPKVVLSTTDVNKRYAGSVNDLYLFYFRNGSFEVHNDPKGWGCVADEYAKNTWYHIDLVMDYDNENYMSYINGEEFAGWTVNPIVMEAKSIMFAIGTGTKLDNVKLYYATENSYDIAKTAWNGDYAEVLLTEGASAAAQAMVADVVVTDKATGAVVTPTAIEAMGRRIIISGLDKSKAYEVTIPAGYTSVTGGTLVNNVAEIAAPEFNITSVKITVDENGTELTDDLKAALKAGDKVYVEVKYINETGADKAFTTMGATYASNRMTDVNYAEVTALGSVTDTVTKYVELDVTDVTNFDAKAFVVDGFTNLTPIK